jgi:hypothetical protein
MKKLLEVLVVLCFGSSIQCLAQKTCTSNPTTISSDINFGSIVWTAGGGATTTECNDMADGLITFTGDVIVDLANNKTITISNDVEIIGNFPISGGPGSKLSVNGGTLHVTQDLGDALNNGVQYEVVSASDAIIVDGTLYGKNNNAFTGSGSISGGTLNVKNGSTCGTPCPVSGGFTNCIDSDEFCSSNGVLPITLLYFTVVVEGKKAVLDWATVLEENFENFVIERSQNGLEFTPIGVISGAGKDVFDVESKYHFVDSSPLIGFNYYRLKAVDLDGSVEYFVVRVVKITGPKLVSVYPNPADGKSIFFKLNFNPSEQDQAVLVNSLGVEVLRSKIHSIENSLDFDPALSPGVYILRYESADFESIIRISIP